MVRCSSILILLAVQWTTAAYPDHGWNGADEVSLLQTMTQASRSRGRLIQKSTGLARKYETLSVLLSRKISRLNLQQTAKKGRNAALEDALAKSHQTPGWDPPGAPCGNCDENGDYRVPDRDNCTTQPAERKFIQDAKQHLTQNPYDYEFVDGSPYFALTALTCTDYWVESGALDFTFGILKAAADMPSNYTTDQRNWFEMRAWMALSDHSISSDGAPIIANYGGPNKGIQFMVDALKTHHKPFELKYDTPEHAGIDRLTLRYEITCNIAGILNNDPTGEFGKAAVDAGFLEEALYTMQAEREKCSPQWATCASLDGLLNSSNPYAASNKARLLDLGAEDITESAVAYCSPYQPRGDELFMADMTWEEVHPADQACGILLEFLRSDACILRPAYNYTCN
mmetsp:Transcript_76865/g.146224  ORF Transcript_76865/g.146224 Transcript_76865/m.146224 type:complete len:399 (+) Transcript_76865:74-1270(+)